MWLKPKSNEIKAAREKSGLTARALSLKAGLGAYAVGRMEYGIHRAHPLRAKALAETLGCKIEDLFEIPEETDRVNSSQQKGA